ASLVEKEGSTDEDRKNIASVFYNRLNQGMPLQSNIAILYAEGKLGKKTTLAEDAAIDTNIDSAFNVYKNPGLMPGPVDSPSLS
ncbi:endolytic transglycosylase MltG, partial [Streptococcus pneumoniae]|nr:endolytic transglycosylase MltG [Streptococcus pneumoniae]